MVSLLDILLEEVGKGAKKLGNLLGVEEVKEQHNNPTHTPTLKPTTNTHIAPLSSDFREVRPDQTKTVEELAYLDSIEKPKMTERVQ